MSAEPESLPDDDDEQSPSGIGGARPPAPSTTDLPLGLLVARRVGVGLGVFLLAWALVNLAGAFPGDGEADGSAGFEHYLKSLLFAALGALYLVPWRRVEDPATWRRLFALTALVTVVFTFTLLFMAMFNYIEMNRIGKKPGLPAFQGTLVFLSLLQLPVIIFVRRPELLD